MTGLKQIISDFARKKGVDLIGFGSIRRFKDLPALQNPLAILPEAKTVIALGFRVLRGMFRGVEEGTTYYQYTTMGIEMLEEVYMPNVMLEICSMIEDNGFTAVPQKRFQLLMNDTVETNPEMDYTRIYRNTDTVQMDFNKAAVACGIGEIGKSGSVLTDDFGPFQRFCFIITDAEIEEDPVAEKHLCDNCGKCRQACPGKALGEEKDGKYELNTWQCAVYTQGANITKNPFLKPDALMDIPDRLKVLYGEKQLTPSEAKEVMDRLRFYPSFRHGYAVSICGRACDRACYIHLEERNVLKRKFHNKFREGQDWVLE